MKRGKRNTIGIIFAIIAALAGIGSILLNFYKVEFQSARLKITPLPNPNLSQVSIASFLAALGIVTSILIAKGVIGK